MGYGGRDVEVVSLSSEQCLVVACDSCGAIGDKEFDAVQVSPYIVGIFTTRVALMEVLATGAEPVALTVTVANEPFPTGGEVIAGVRDELATIGKRDLPMVISTEKNIPTGQTGVGITVVGAVEKERLRVGRSRPGDCVYSLGWPKVGDEVVVDDGKAIALADHVRALLAHPGVHEVIPVGSKGIRAEAENLAGAVHCRIREWQASAGLDLEKSAGPSTCLVFTSGPEPPEIAGAPIHYLGRLSESDG
ncbi:alpha-ribazole kinase [Heliobacterium undosum]|uniref:Alpha-ribazole kinase n=1 Tax=Heliomicrobium undosum TaxID=121734 RepID=A0A845LAA3_9FIRM|nr:AIR synthase related protein [Heliomicrobium undosum]MZP29841.1 alpha-ribazole kinase [Heliomicrobium undosum]